VVLGDAAKQEGFEYPTQDTKDSKCNDRLCGFHFRQLIRIDFSVMIAVCVYANDDCAYWFFCSSVFLIEISAGSANQKYINE
jgi:hypothetical protein